MVVHHRLLARSVADAHNPDLGILDLHFVMLRIDVDGVLCHGSSDEEAQ